MISGLVPVRQMDVHDTWAARDLPVLDATVGLLEHSYMVTVTDIAAKIGLDPSIVAQALDALDPVYVDFRKTTTGGDPRFWYVFKVTPEARRAVGQWPTAEALANRLAWELSVAARQERDAEQQGLLTYAARLIGDTLRDATVRAAEAVLAPAFGGIPVPELGQQVPPPEPRPDLRFESLVPLPELPDLLRPDLPDGRDQLASVTTPPEAAHPEPAPPEPAHPEPAPPEPAHAEPASPEPAHADPTQLEAAQLEPVQPESVQPEPVQPESAQPEPAPEPATPAALDLTTQPEAETAAPIEPELTALPEAETAAPIEPELTALPEAQLATPIWPEATTLPGVVSATSTEPLADVPDLNPWPERVRAVDVDPDAADTDLDLVQARQDRA